MKTLLNKTVLNYCARREASCGDLHAFLPDDAHCRQELNHVHHHARLLRVHGSGQQRKTPLLTHNSFQAILQHFREKGLNFSG